MVYFKINGIVDLMKCVKLKIKVKRGVFVFFFIWGFVGIEFCSLFLVIKNGYSKVNL